MQLSQHPRNLLSLLMTAIALVWFTTACGSLTEFENDFDTEFTIPAPPDGGGFGPVEPYSKTKVFKFSDDPNDAEFAKFKEAIITVLAPSGADFSFLNKLEVYVEKDNEMTLLATAKDFNPGETRRELKIEYTGDLRGFIDGQRVRLTWIVYPSAWTATWPEDGVTIRTEVVMRIKADIL